MLESFYNRNHEIYAILSQEERDTPRQICIWKKFLTELNNRFMVKYIPIVEQHSVFSNPSIHLMKILKLQ
jgi:hypothetical protein